MRNSSVITTGLLALIWLFAGCGSSTTAGGGKNRIEIVFDPAPPASMYTGETASVVAIVAHDSLGEGVTWRCAPVSACGSFSPVQTASGASTTYTAPTTVPQGAGVTLTATSMSNSMKMASATVSITVPPISVSLSTPPPASMQTAATATVAAVVSNDSANKGVTWSCTPTNACGSFNPAETGSGMSATYTAPANVPQGGNVVLTATSASDSTKMASATVTIAPPAVSVSISPSNPTVVENADQQFTATIGNDPANAGVTWSVSQNGQSCAPTCGSLSGQTFFAVTYTAPGALPSPTTVTLTATSITDATKSSSVVITVSKPDMLSLLKGQYAFELGSFDGGTVGSFVADGNGTITGGVYDDPYWGTNVAITSGSYAIGTDRRGTLDFVDANNLTWTFAFALDSVSSGAAQKGSVIETDSNNYDCSGFLVLQDPTSFASGFSGSGTYAFETAGWDSDGNPEVIVGSASLSSAGVISSGLFDANDNASVTAEAAFTGTISMTPTGRGTISTTIPGGASGFVYAVDANHLLVIYPDTSTIAVEVGEITQQTGGPYSVSSLGGNSIIQQQTTDGGGDPETLAGIVNFDSNGTFSYSADQNDAGTVSSQSASGTTNMTDAFNGRFTLTTTGGDTEAVYLVAPNQGFIADINPGAQPELGTLDAQSAGPFNSSSLNGTVFVQTLPLISNAPGNTAPMTVVSGVVTFNDGSLTETRDADVIGYSDVIGTIYSGQTVTDTYTVGSNGRVTTNSGNMILYVVSPGQIVVLDTAASTGPNPDVQVMQQ